MHPRPNNRAARRLGIQPDRYARADYGDSVAAYYGTRCRRDYGRRWRLHAQHVRRLVGERARERGSPDHWRG